MNGLIEEINANVLQLTTGSARVFHGRGKMFVGHETITVEYLSGILLVVLFQHRSKEWREEFILRMTDAECASSIDQVLFQARYEKKAPVFDVNGEDAIVQKVIEENGLKYQLNLGGSQNYGFFTDMAKGRDWVRAHSEGQRVLNLFSYTCSFSVAAIAGGAERVVNIDMSSAALSVGRNNHQLNNASKGHASKGHVSKDNVVFQKLNILKSWSRINRFGPYDLVIVDPPSFQKGSFSAAKDYPKMVNRLSSMTAENADILFCLNDPLIQVEEFKGWLESEHFTFISKLENPLSMKEQEQNVGLKVLHYQKTSLI